MAVTREQIIAIFKTMGVPTDIKDDVNFMEQGFDSIDVPRGLVAISKEFKIDMSDVVGEQVKTMNLLVCQQFVFNFAKFKICLVYKNIFKERIRQNIIIHKYNLCICVINSWPFAYIYCDP